MAGGVRQVGTSIVNAVVRGLPAATSSCDHQSSLLEASSSAGRHRPNRQSKRYQRTTAPQTRDVKLLTRTNFITKAKAKDLSFMFEAKANDLCFPGHCFLKDFSRTFADSMFNYLLHSN